MPVIQHQIHQFVWVHNTHAIRKQRNRDFYLPTGKPYKMYHHPPTHVRNYAASPDPELLSELELPLQTYDMDEYLTESTMALCIQLLQSGNYPIQFDFGGDNTHKHAYAYLRRALYMHEQLNETITEVEHPIGAGDWVGQNIERQTVQQDSESTTFGLRPINEEEEQQDVFESMSGFMLTGNSATNEILEWPAYDDSFWDLGDDGLLLNV